MENPNKPWWVGKTCKEMEGKRVRVTYRRGLEVCGILNPTGDFNYGLDVTRNESADEFFTPLSEVVSIDLLDDGPEYERIGCIEDVREGDLFVTRDGNKFKVHSTHPLLKGIMTCRVRTDTYSTFLPDCLFSHALREKPRTPNHDGLWADASGDIAVFTGRIGRYVRVREEDDDKWVLSYPVLTSDGVRNNAPWTPCKVVDA